MWRTEMKHFCDQECLLKFYCQQNEPIMVTQKGPENTIGTNIRVSVHCPEISGGRGFSHITHLFCHHSKKPSYTAGDGLDRLNI